MEEKNEKKKLEPKIKAAISLGAGILSFIAIFTGWGACLSIALGIVALVFAKMAKKEGYVGATRTAGFVFGLIGIILGGLVLLCLIVMAVAGIALLL